MEIIYSEENYDCKESYIALGKFDGVHKGHSNLIKELEKKAKLNDAKSILFTFENHPFSILDLDKTPKLIMDNDTKFNVLSKTNIDYVFIKEFTKEFANLTPEEFINYLQKKFNVKGIVVGFNFKFGRKNSGNIEVLKKILKEKNIELYIINPVKHENELVSSSRIRALIENGEMKKVNELLYEPFSIFGKIIRGKQIGRLIGFPTVNIEMNKDLIVPKCGVYYSNLIFKDTIYKSLSNIGFNPTVNGIEKTFETFILDFDKEIYDEYVRIYFSSKIRNETKFNNLNELKNQLEIDLNFAKNQKKFINPEICEIT